MFVKGFKKKKKEKPDLAWICEERKGDVHGFTEQNKVHKL